MRSVIGGSVNTYRTSVSYTGPGDVVAGAVAWWGLRAYSSSARGANAVRIRRTSDNAEQDFVTLSNGSLDRVSMLSFLSGTEGRIVTLYDQSGNSRPVTQATAGNQPIVNLTGFGLTPVLLLHMDGADASTTFTDSSGRGHTVTANGNAQIDTAQSVFGGESGLFDGTGDYLTLDGSSDFAFGLGDFTIDFRFRINSAGTQVLFDGRGSGQAGARPMMYTTANNLRYFTNGSDQIAGTTTLATNTWYHAALTRRSGSTRLFLDGIQEGSTYVDTNDYLAGTIAPYIGADGNSPGANAFNGWIDELRIIKGAAAWTGNFTPPTAAYSVGDDKVVAEFVTASSHKLACTSPTITQSQPYTFQSVAYVYENTGLDQVIVGAVGIVSGYRASVGDAAYSYAGTHLVATASNKQWHSIGSVFNSTSSDLNIDGTVSTGDAGTGGLSASALYVGNVQDIALLGGLIGETGIWPSDFSSTQSSNMASNQRDYWGFGSYTGPEDVL